MLTNFIYAKSKAMFKERLHEVPNDAIVFIEDTKEIWNHGHYFAGETIDPSIVSDLQTAVAQMQSNKLDSSTAESTYAKKTEIPTPDWNASTYKEGHIKNRTHHMQDYMCHYFKGSPIKISKPSGVGYVLLTYDTDLADKFIRIEISAAESKTHEFLDAMGMPIIFRWDAGNSTINVESFAGAVETYGMRAYYSSSAKSYDEYFVKLDKGFLPESSAGTIDSEPVASTEPTEEFPQVLYTEQNLTEAQKSQARKNIGADNTELKEQITELSVEIEHQGIFIEDLQNTKIDRENDDYYPKMAVGLADNLAGVDVVDSTINFRRSGGGAISDGVARIESIKGNSVVWNQMVDNAATELFKNGNTNAVLSVEGDTITLTATTAGAIYVYYRTQLFMDSLIVGHKYLRISELRKSSNVAAYVRMQGIKGDSDTTLSTNDTWSVVSSIFTITEKTSASPYMQFTIMNAAVGDYISFRKTIFVDLTKMFGTSNEPTTIEEFYARIPMGVDMNAYNEGTIYNMKATGIKSVGVNAWDEQWEKGKFSTTDGTNQAADGTMRMVNKVAVLPNSAYYFKSPVDTWVLFYDKDGKVIEGYSTGINSYQNACNVKNVTFTTPSNAASMRAYFNQYFASVVGYQNDICLNLSNSELNGKYFPHLEASEDLSIVAKYFPQGMSKVKSAYGLVKSDEISHDKASNRWNAYNAIKGYNLGDFTWERAEYDGGVYVFYTYEQLKDIDYSENGTLLLSPRYNAHAVGAANFINLDMRIFKSSSRLYIRDDAYTNKDDFKASLQGMPLYCVLAEPIVTELDEVDQFKDLDYKVWNDGTEKAIAEGKSAPLAADITYGFNAIGKIKELESLVAALRAKVGI